MYEKEIMITRARMCNMLIFACFTCDSRIILSHIEK